MKVFLEAAFFDLDGTLIDSAPDVLSCLASALEEEQLQITGASLESSLLVPPLPEIVEMVVPGLPVEKKQSVIRTYRRCYDNSSYADSHAFPGILELLQRLSSSGVKLFVASNKLASASRKILEKCGILKYFHATIHPDTLKGQTLNKRQMLEMLLTENKLNARHCIMTGDGMGDMDAAKYNGVISAAALYGYGPRELLLAQNPEICLPRPDWRDGFFRVSGQPFLWEGPEMNDKSHQ